MKSIGALITLVLLIAGTCLAYEMNAFELRAKHVDNEVLRNVVTFVDAAAAFSKENNQLPSGLDSPGQKNHAMMIEYLPDGRAIRNPITGKRTEPSQVMYRDENLVDAASGSLVIMKYMGAGGDSTTQIVGIGFHGQIICRQTLQLPDTTIKQ